MGRLNNFIKNPWLTQMDPYQVVPNVYYIGNKYVGSYLLNTNSGLILIDVTMQETAYLLFESIRKLGFDPANIKKVLISHGHIDHCGAARLVQEYSGCDIYFPIGDLFFLTKRRDLLLCEDRVPTFKVTGYYDYSNIMDFGNIRIKPVHTPGHTPGCTSFLLSVNCGKENLLLGMHGGLGLNGLSLAELEENRLPLSLQEDYLHSLEKIAKEPVDIVIPSHASHYPGDYFAIAAQNDGTGEVLRIPGAWEKLINGRISQIKEVIARDHAQ
ncbi:MBL fold metallo-hydrolase [Caproicibacterium sp. NSD3]